LENSLIILNRENILLNFSAGGLWAVVNIGVGRDFFKKRK